MSVSVHSVDEWSQLKEVVVGTIEGFQGFHFDNTFNLFYWENIKPFLESENYFQREDGSFQWPTIDLEDYIVSELIEDIQEFVDTLENLNVIVRRPEKISGSVGFATPFWSSTQIPALNVRDQTIILGSNIIETAPHVRARIFENDYLKPLFYEYFEKGANWYCMPRPTLSANTLDARYFSLDQKESLVLKDYNSASLLNLGYEMVFDGAQCIRLGENVLVNVANKNHELGYLWLCKNFGDTFNFHRLDRMSDNHIDSCLLPLKPGLWLVRNPKILDFLPEAYRKWDYIVAPEAKEDLFPSYQKSNIAISSKFIDMNILSVNEETVIANSLFPEMIKLLEKNKFTVIPVRHRHRRMFGGGFHCFTLDICRTGQMQSYDL